ncbi:MAG: ABC transporter ATP-binding protein [Clostridiales bacterium]|nr:ABC transporter ATP-binding protein [Clostridiales bacterium]
MQVLKKILKENRGWVFISLIVSFMAIGAQLFYTHVIGILVDRIVDNEAVLPSLVVLLFLLILGFASLNYLNHMVGNYTAEKASHSLRMGYMRYLIRNASSSNLSTDKAMSVIQGELASTTDFLSNTFFFNVSMVVTSIAVLIFLLIENVILTIAILIPTLLILIYVSLSGSKLAKIAKATLAAKSRMNKTAFGVVQNHPVISVYGASAFVEEKFEEELTVWGQYMKKDDRLHAVLNSISGLLSQVPLLFLFLIGGYMVVSGKLTLGELVVFLHLQSSVTGFLMNTPIFIAHFRTFTSNLSRIDVV